MQNVDAGLGQIAEQLHRVARQVAAQLELFKPIGILNRRHAAAVGPKTGPAAARADRGEQIGIGDAKMPSAVAAHRMAGEVGASVRRTGNAWRHLRVLRARRFAPNLPSRNRRDAGLWVRRHGPKIWARTRPPDLRSSSAASCSVTIIPGSSGVASAHRSPTARLPASPVGSSLSAARTA